MTGPVFVDTSAIYAVLDPHDRQNFTAGEILVDLITSGSTMVTHSAVIHECSALVQRRLGMAERRDLHGRLLPLFDIEWVDAAISDRAVGALMAADRRDASLVDWTSFEVMRRRAIRIAFAFHDDFVAQGIDVLTR